jgi:hypothetical protein
VTVPAFTILTLTGNNIGPKGDLASRNLVTRLDVDRADPENRPFKHSDPIAWTLGNRGAILRALYILMRGNPQLQDRKPEKTRFKRWWHLIGSAVEHAARSLVAAGKAKNEADGSARAIDFGAIFASVEGEDEESSSLAEVLEVLYSVWPTDYFQASQVAKLINEPMQDEAEQARQLREYFENSGRRSSGDVTSMVVGRRLGMVADVPMLASGRTLKLVRYQPDERAQKRLVARFKVRVL